MTWLLRMTAALAAFAGVCLAQGEPLAVEARLLSREVFVGERVIIRVRVAYDARYFAEHGVPLLQRRMEVPFCLQPDADGRGEAVQWRDAEDGLRVAFGDREVLAERGADEQRNGARWSVIVLGATWEAATPGLVELRLPRARYAFTSRYETSLLGGRQPVDRHEAEAVAAGLQVLVKPIPVVDRPAGFSGAVGEFHVDVQAPEVVELGDSFALQLRVGGGGNLAAFAAPPWPELPGFAVQGLAERSAAAEREFVFDVLALRLGATLPPLSFSYFDPVSERFATISARCATRVIERRPGRPLPPRVQGLVDQAQAAGGDARLWWWGAGLSLLVAAVLAMLWARARR